MLNKILEQKLQQAVKAVLPDAEIAASVIRPCPDPRFGDYQNTSLMSLARSRSIDARQLAFDVAAKMDIGQWCLPVEVAGAGFLNFRLKPTAIAAALQEASRSGALFFQKTTQPRCFVIDFSSPNVAKPMHVGHIRSTILGDSLARLLRLLGHRVITDNHIGDWGTQFGKLIVGWKTQLDGAQLAADPIGEMERLYKVINSACEEDSKVLEEARRELVKLQSGDEENAEIWREMIALSESQFDRVYSRLGVRFDYTLGESAYNSRLAAVVEDLTVRHIATHSQGAMVVFFSGIHELKEKPAIIRKSDGGYNYMTTDLATLQFRVEGGAWGVKPDEIVYVTGAPQQLHFKQLFAIFRGWRPEVSVKLVHAWFGSVLGEDGKPFKTRAGETVRLEDLLDEAEERAFAAVSEKNPELNETQRREIARIVGLGAIKYSDLSQNRQSDYIFNWDRMLSLQGNTAPYLLYAYTRIQGIFRKGGDAGEISAAGEFVLKAPEELALARRLLNFGIVLESAAEDYRPNFLCAYLYELAGDYARFYENCPVLNGPAVTRATRLALSDLTARVLKQGLDVLGIEITEQM